MAFIECDTDHPVFNGLLLPFLKGAKMEQKIPATSSLLSDSSNFPKSSAEVCINQ